MGGGGVVLVCGQEPPEELWKVLALASFSATSLPSVRAAQQAVAERSGPAISAVVADLRHEAAGWASLRQELRQLGDVPRLGVVDSEQVYPGREALVELDDFAVLPFPPDELYVRLSRLIAEPPPVVDDEFQFDMAQGGPRYQGRALGLTPMETRLLETLVANRGRVLSKGQLLRLCWGYEAFSPNVVEVRLSRLRRKLSRADGPPIETVRGFGYRLGP